MFKFSFKVKHLYIFPVLTLRLLWDHKTCAEMFKFSIKEARCHGPRLPAESGATARACKSKKAIKIMTVSETGRSRFDLAEIWLRYGLLTMLNHLRKVNIITSNEELPNKSAMSTCVLLRIEHLSWVQVNACHIWTLSVVGTPFGKGNTLTRARHWLVHFLGSFRGLLSFSLEDGTNSKQCPVVSYIYP